MKESSKSPGPQGGPSGREIRDACREIQEKWSEAERRKRAGLPKVDPWIPPIVHLNQMGYDVESEAET